VDFFDRDQDGIIYPRDTYVGFRCAACDCARGLLRVCTAIRLLFKHEPPRTAPRRRIGLGRLISFGAIFVIHGTFAYPTSPSWLPSLFFPIYLNRMHRTKHGSDSGVYDTEGRFVPEKFEGTRASRALADACDGEQRARSDASRASALLADVLAGRWDVPAAAAHSSLRRSRQSCSPSSTSAARGRCRGTTSKTWCTRA
jgi:hypothetical protein